MRPPLVTAIGRSLSLAVQLNLPTRGYLLLAAMAQTAAGRAQGI